MCGEMNKFIINKIFIAFMCITLIPSFLSAQNQQQRKFDPSLMQPNGKISGTIVDAQNLQTIEYANVVVYRWRDSTVVGGTVSNSKGKFLIDKLVFGRYYLKVSYIGYSTKRYDSLIVTPRKTEYNYNLIKLKPKNVNLNEVVVNSQKEATNYNLDKKVFNVDLNLANSGGTAVDILQNIPSVTVDADGGVAVRGNTNITVLVDGKPAELAGFSGSDVLAQIPASSIESIELVTNPSAKYDPDGTGGIINVILKRKSNLGLNGTLMGNAGTKGRYNSSVNLNLRSDNFNIFSSYDGRFFNMLNGGNTVRTSSLAGVSNTLDQYSNNINNMKNNSFNIGGDYYFTEQDILSFSTQFRIGDFDNGGTISYKDYLQYIDLDQNFDRISKATRNFNSGNYTLSYKKKFDDKNQEFTADVMYSQSSMDAATNTNQQYYTTDISLVVPATSLQNALSTNTQKTWLVQANYIQPLGAVGRLEAGFKSSIKDLGSNNNYLNFDFATNSWGPSNLMNNDYDYKEQIHAVYGIFSNSLGLLTYQLGLRAEEAYIKGSSVSEDLSFSNNYFEVYPTVHLKYNLSDIDELALSYSRRIDRPNNRQLNPYIDRSDSLNWSQGNLNLKPQFFNSFEMGYTTLVAKTSLITNLFYRSSNNLISTITTLSTSQNGTLLPNGILLPNSVTYSTFENIASGQSYGAEFIAASQVSEWLKLNGNVSVFNNSVDDPSLGGNRTSTSWIARLNTTFTLIEGLQLQLMFNYNSPSLLIQTGGGSGGIGGGGFFGGSTAQSKVEEQHYMDLMLRDEVMNGMLTFTLRVTDVFNTRTFNTETTGSNFYQTNNRIMDTRIASLGVSFRIVDSSKRPQEQEIQRKIDEGIDEL
jgi:outer membrane receptor protein involved in Fe transport